MVVLVGSVWWCIQVKKKVAFIEDIRTVSSDDVKEEKMWVQEMSQKLHVTIADEF